MEWSVPGQIFDSMLINLILKPFRFKVDIAREEIALFDVFFEIECFKQRQSWFDSIATSLFMSKSLIFEFVHQTIWNSLVRISHPIGRTWLVYRIVFDHVLMIVWNHQVMLTYSVYQMTCMH